ncbi:MAG: urease accessory protein UreE [Gammaproteobacteria bacterium]|nr:urease accessory protein UreE [Gammaproteobacteria bacterium]
MLTLTQRLPADPNAAAPHRLVLSAEERTRSRQRFVMENGEEVQLMLPRGTLLRDGDLLAGADGSALVRVRAMAEPVLTARAAHALTLLRAAYHLGNRHVALELGCDYLRLSPDSVLADMLVQLGLTTVSETAPFQPEPGAYGGHGHEFVRPPHLPHG